MVALVVGGSGMLAELCIQLAKEYSVVGVLGRRLDRLKDLSSKVQNISIIQSDYSRKATLKSSLDTFVDRYGRPELIVAWIHSTAPQAAELVAEYGIGDFYEVTGHNGKNAEHMSYAHEIAIDKLGLKYHRVILGQKGNRWLTNSEISYGVYEAINLGSPEYLVGE